MNQIINIDTYNMQATCQCGTPAAAGGPAEGPGPHHRHSPQSKLMAHLGGLVATRASASFPRFTAALKTWSGLEAVFPDGHIARSRMCRAGRRVPISPVIIGNEGPCFITEVTVKITSICLRTTSLRLHPESMKTGFEIRAGDGQRLPPLRDQALRPRRRILSFSAFFRRQVCSSSWRRGPKALPGQPPPPSRRSCRATPIASR